MPPRLPTPPRLHSLFTTVSHYHFTSHFTSYSNRYSTNSIPPTPARHTSLSTFLAHATQTSLPPQSPTYIGTHYEYTCQSALHRLGFSLSRTGGRDDRGVDLYGTWKVPSLGSSGSGNTNSDKNGGESMEGEIRCIVQCKAWGAGKGGGARTKGNASGRLKPPGPSSVRELEGAFAGAPHPSWRGDGVLGVICAVGGATKGVREAMARSRRGLVWVLVEPGMSEEVEGESSGGKVRQMVWNAKAGDLGLEGVGVGIRYGGDGDEMEGGRGGEVVLLWKGEVWEPEMGWKGEDESTSV